MSLKWLLPLSLLVLSLSFLWWYTLGFSAFTVFSYTLKRVGDPPYRIPPVRLVCHDGRRVVLGEREGGRVFVNFIYLNCFYGCPMSLTKMYYLRERAGEGDLFVSVTVDPSADTLERLRERWSALGAFSNWLFCRPEDADWRDKLIRMGVWVYRREDGLINHTLDIFLIEGPVVRKVIPPTGGLPDSGVL